jgi:hypothetical protein
VGLDWLASKVVGGPLVDFGTGQGVNRVRAWPCGRKSAGGTGDEDVRLGLVQIRTTSLLVLESPVFSVFQESHLFPDEMN